MNRRELARADRQRQANSSGQAPSFLEAVVMRPSFLACYLYRVSSTLIAKGPTSRRAALVVARVNVLLTGCWINSLATIGPGLYLPHPNGVVIGACVAGDNLMVMQHASIGVGDMRHDADDPANFPEMGDNVFIGAGAVVAGRISIGSDSRIGANAVVLKDVPRGGFAVGVPAPTVGSPLAPPELTEHEGTGPSLGSDQAPHE